MNFLKRLFGLFAELGERGVTLNLATKTDWDAVIPEYWDKAVMYEADRMSIMSKLTGKDGSDAPILEKEDLTKQKGDKITFTSMQRLLGKGVSGTTALEGAEEDMVPGVFAVTVELFRHATAANKIATVEALYDFPAVAARQLSDWLARFQDDDMVDQVLNVDTITALYAGDAAARGDLGPGDLFLPHELRALHMAGQRRGIREFQTVRGGKMPFPVFGALLSEVDYYNLVNDAEFRSDVRLAAARGGDNPALSGHIDMYQGIMLYRWSSVNPGDGMVGSFLRPEARLAATITSSGTTITAGPTTAITNVDYWQYFPQSGTNTLLIESEQITYTATPGDSSLTVATRGAGGTTQVAHTAGALMTLNNVGKVLLFGKNFALRAWAQRPRRIRQERDYQFEQGLGLEWIYENKGVENADNTLANAIVMETYSPNPNTI